MRTRPIALLVALAAPLVAQPKNQLHYPENDELGAQLVAADAARAEERWEEAVDAYRLALDGDRPNGVGYQVAPWTEQGGAGRRFRGVTQWAIDGLRALPGEGVAVFRRRYDAQAAAHYRRALEAKDPCAALVRTYELYPIASCSVAILETLGELALERGQPGRAARAFGAALAHHEGEAPPRVRQKLQLAQGLVPAPTPRRAPMVRLDAANRAHADARLAAAETPRFESRSPELLMEGRGVPRHLPVVERGTAFLVVSDRIIAFDLRTGAERPTPRVAPADQRVELGPKALLGGAVESGILVAPQVATVEKAQAFRGIPVRVALPIRKQAGFDVDAWTWRWDQAALLEGTPAARWSWPCPAVCDEGVAFSPAWGIEGFVNSYATATDVRTGELLWTTWVASGQVEQTMFGEQASEPLCVPMAASGDLVFHASCLGCLTALDKETGRPVWVTEYEQIEVRAPKGFHADPRSIGWECCAPVVDAGVVVAAPLDSDHAYGLDARSGEVLWRSPRRQALVDADMRWLIGAANGRAILGGGHEVRCLDVRTGKALWRARVDRRGLVARGMLARGQVVVALDDEVVQLDLGSGELGRRDPLAGGGNLLVLDDLVLVVTGDGRVIAHDNRGPRQRE